MFVRALPVICLAMAACGGSDGGNPADAKQADAAPATVLGVTCPATPAATVTTDNATFSYAPASVTITQGQVVKFTMSSFHNVAPAAAMSDAGLSVGFGMEKCLMFTKAGTFKFKCDPHAFVGTVVVQ